MRRPPLHAAAWWVGYGLLVLAGAVAVIGPSNLAFRGAFIAWRPPLDAPTPPGDHLQVAYNFWQWLDGLRHLRLPFADAYQFAATGHEVAQPFGWPLVLVSIPVSLVAGPVAAYNVVLLASFLGCALFTAAWARAVGLSRPAAAVAGIAFAFAPYRLVQLTSHANALLAPTLPLVVLCVEKALQGGRRARAWGWAAAAAEVSVVASGELHLAVFSAGLLALYLVARWPLVRSRARVLTLPAAALVAGSAVVAALHWATVLAPSVASGGRSLDEAAGTAPRLSNLVKRTGPYAWPYFERYGYLGVVVVGLAVVGAVAALRRRKLLVGAMTALAVGCVYLAVVPSFVGHPLIQRSYRVLPFFGYTRVPGRVLLVAALPLALLAALAVDAIRAPRPRVIAAAFAIGAILIDAPPDLFAANAVVRAALPGVSRGDAVLELPAFDPGHFSGAVYAFEITQAPGPRVGGYSPYVTPAIQEAQARSASLSDPPVDACRWKDEVRRLSIDRVVVHRAFYGPDSLQWHADGKALVRQMDTTAGFTRVGEKADVVVYRVDADAFAC